MNIVSKHRVSWGALASSEFCLSKCARRALNQSWLEHADVAAGGELILTMGPTAVGWGRQNLTPSQ